MSDRQSDLLAFVRGAGWGDAEVRPIAGDASNRRYLRATRPAGSAIVMDAPPDRGEDVRPFVAIARHLSSLELSAPQILAEDPASGFLLLEDLGDDIFARVLERQPDKELLLYHAAAEALAALHRHPPPDGLAAYDGPLMSDRAALAYGWYLRGITGQEAGAATTEMRRILEDLLARLAPGTPVLVLRDFHAENLIWLPERDGPRRVGLLDFQDALAGHPAYDLASLLTDARRDVSQALREATMTHFLDHSGQAAAPFRAASAVLGAQRNLRILGVFARLSMLYGKPGYVRLIPRVWGHLMRDLDHPDLVRLRDRVTADLPPPTASALSRLEALCGTAAP